MFEAGSCQFTPREADAPLRVLAFRGRERLSGLFKFELDLLVPNLDVRATASALLGETGQLKLYGNLGFTRQVFGLVNAVEPLPAHDANRVGARVRARFGPRAWLLGRGANFRIFQASTIPDIVSTILGERDLPLRLSLRGEHRVHDNIVQYDESDLAFVARILAREGMHFSFEHSDDEQDVFVVSDQSSPQGDMGPSLAVPFREDDGLRGTGYTIEKFGNRQSIREASGELTGFDYRRPLRPVRGESGPHEARRDRRGNRKRFIDSCDSPRVDEQLAQTRLEQDRASASLSRGETIHFGFSPGLRFELQGSPSPADDGIHHVVAVRHSFDAARDSPYVASFSCVPEGVTHRPPAPPRRVVQVTETAKVVGPPGQEIYTDELGRIKVQFHWDQYGGNDERSSCWIRAMQPWTGGGFGFQFIPRIGMEVIVAFLGGNLDLPIVIGTAFNTTSPPVFPLPAQKTRSGIRTHSTRNGDGYNELSFEDRTGYEQLIMRAERDLDVTVQHDATTRVGNTMTEHVTQHHFEIVGGNRIASVTGNDVASVAGNASQTVEGDLTQTVRGNTRERVVGRRERAVEGDDVGSVGGASRSTIEGSSNSHVIGDQTVRTNGSLTFVVGAPERLRSYRVHTEGTIASYSSGETEIVADQGLTLRCGQSTISLRPDRIEINSPEVRLSSEGVWLKLAEQKLKMLADEKIVMKSDGKVFADGGGATLSLKGEAKLDGSAVKLASPDDETVRLETEVGEITTIRLVDQANRPLAHQRYRIVLEDGSERTGMLDENGGAEVRLPSGGRVFFAEMSDVAEV